MEVPKRERLKELFRRLGDAPEAGSSQEALDQLANVLNGVEDELTDIPFSPERWRSDGRIYPPQEDSVSEVPGHPHVKRYRTVAHYVYIGANGSTEIVALDGTLEFRKVGTDERDVWELN